VFDGFVGSIQCSRPLGGPDRTLERFLPQSGSIAVVSQVRPAGIQASGPGLLQGFDKVTV